MIKVAIVCSNYYNIEQKTRKGTEIFNYTLITNLAKYAKSANLSITAFASGDSKLPVPVESINRSPSSSDDELLKNEKHIIFELALLSKAFSMQNRFDLYHINIGDGDIAVPFSPFIKKPILITLHHLVDAEFSRKYFSLFKKYHNVFFISASNTQRKFLPDLNYLTTIYHGIDTSLFPFYREGGESIMWAGRAIPTKGADIVVEIAIKLKKQANLFGILEGHKEWLKKTVIDKISTASQSAPISFKVGLDRLELVKHFQKSRLFLFPIQWEEPFGLVMIEAMACGTPVVAFARGSVPEIVKDGKTGFVVNSSDSDIRGNWVIKKTGIEGLREAVERIYAMPQNDYLTMRQACRKHIEKNFGVEKMTESYIGAYQTAISLSKKLFS